MMAAPIYIVSLMWLMNWSVRRRSPDMSHTFSLIGVSHPPLPPTPRLAPPRSVGCGGTSTRLYHIHTAFCPSCTLSSIMSSGHSVQYGGQLWWFCSRLSSLLIGPSFFFERYPPFLTCHSQGGLSMFTIHRFIRIDCLSRSSQNVRLCY